MSADPSRSQQSIRRRLVFALITVAVVVLGVLLLPGHLGLPPLTSHSLWTAGQLTPAPASQVSSNWYSRDFSKKPRGKSIANFGASIYSWGGSVNYLYISFSHDQSYRMDSLRLTFRRGLMPPSVALEVPWGSPSSQQRFSYDKDGRSVTWSVDHLGFVGTGSLQLTFLLQLPAGASPNDVYTVETAFTLLHGGPVQLVRYVADGSLEFSLPPGSGAN